MLGHGLRPSTMRAIAAQLLAERRDPGLKLRRAVLLDQPFSTTCSVISTADFASTLPRFSASMCAFSTLFLAKHGTGDASRFLHRRPIIPSLPSAILYGYQAMDRLIGQFLKDYPETTLVLATAPSQKPWVETTKCTYRPDRFEDLLSFAGIQPAATAVKPVMAEEFFARLRRRGDGRSPCESRFRHGLTRRRPAADEGRADRVERVHGLRDHHPDRSRPAGDRGGRRGHPAVRRPVLHDPLDAERPAPPRWRALGPRRRIIGSSRRSCR